MNNFKNEKGMALVLTLFIVTLMLLFALTLFSQVINTTKQVTTIEKNIDARNVAEMGIEYYYQKIKHKHEQDTSKDIQDIIELINKDQVSFDNRSFELLQVKIDESDPNKINISCEGTAFGQKVAVENEIMLVEN